MMCNGLPSVTHLCGDERQKITEKETGSSSLFQFPGRENLWNQMRDRARTEVSFLEGKNMVNGAIFLDIIPFQVILLLYLKL